MSTNPGAASALEPRAVTREIEIDAPVETVWTALTDARELARWFPLEAQATPGLGGSIWLRWDAADETDQTRIETWEPGRHLRAVGYGGSWEGIATDYYLEGRGGGTVLRVVSSGFGPGEAGESVARSYGTGWDFELRSLRHYLQRHRGRDRRVAWPQVPYQCTDQEAWARITGPGGWLGAEGVAHLPPGARFLARTPDGDDVTGAILVVEAPDQLAATVDRWNDSLLRVMLYRRVASVWLATWGVAPAEVDALQRKWQASLAVAF